MLFAVVVCLPFERVVKCGGLSPFGFDFFFEAVGFGLVDLFAPGGAVT